jgi:hypothetical protein
MRKPKTTCLALPAAAGLVLVLLVGGMGCRLVKGAADLPGDAVRVVSPDKPAAAPSDPAHLQQQLMRFSDQYVAGVVAAVDELESTDPAVTRAEVQRLRVAYAADIWMAAAGPNAYANLLDLIAVTSLTRIVVEEYWIPDVFGETALPILEVLRTSEANIWAIAATVLTEDQRAELRDAIREWREEHPEAVHAIAVRAVGAAAEMRSEDSEERARPNSVFRFLMIDPLAGLDPATRELAQTRMAAERALYVAQRMPFMLRWQTEILGSHVAAMPETRRMLTNSSQIAEAALRLSAVAEQLPSRLSQERQEIIESLQSERVNLRELSAEVRETLQAGSQMASNANTVLRSFDGIVERLDKDGTDTNAQPFRIGDYTVAAAQADVTAQRLTTLLQQLDQTLASTNLDALVSHVEPVMEGAESSGRDLVDHLFQRLLLLLVIACALFLGTALLYNRVVRNASTG